jgi:elongation factor Ts
MTITAGMVKELREATGAAVLDCKNALDATEGDMEKAKAILEEKGLATAKKKADREAHEGKVETYTHPGGRVGVMLEVNCETDFVANTDLFQTFVHDLALHIAFAAPGYLAREDVPREVAEAQSADYRREAEASGKPENVIARIVEGKMNKFYEEACLLEQPFIRDEDIKIGDLVIRMVAELKENIVIRRFARFELGESSSENT